MANRITDEFNKILNGTKTVYEFYSKNYMDKRNISFGELLSNKTVKMSDIDMYYRVSGYELYQDIERNNSHISSVAKGILGMTSANNTPVSFSVLSFGSEQKVYFGTNHSCAEQIKKNFSGNMFTISVANEWIRPKVLRDVQKHNGYISGISKLETGAIDRLMNNLQKGNYMFSFVLRPISQSEIVDELFRVNLYIEDFQRVMRTELSIGSNRARRFDNDNQDILQVMEVLNKEKERLEIGRINGLWHIAIHVAAPTCSEYKAVASAVIALLREYSDREKQNTFSLLCDISFPAIDKTIWRIPTAFLGSKNLGGIYGTSLLSVGTFEEASALLMMPIQSHYGYKIKHFGESAPSAGAFDLFPDSINSNDTFELGVLDNGDKYNINLNSLRQHAFITGTTQYGKSTTVKKLLYEVKQRGVPFVVVEAVKKDYWKLLRCAGMNGVKVYSAGLDAQCLRINPFQPEDNTVLDFHIQSILQAFLSLFDDTDPIPQILTELVYLCYEKKRWDVAKRVHSQSDLEYPILSDMLVYLDECIESIGYGEEIKNNMHGVLKIRLTSLIRQAGKSLNTRENISISEMFESSSVIELDDFSNSNKPFVASILAIKANEFSRQMKMENQLKRLLVIEEAHHILPNPELKSASKNAAECSKHFANMLAEVSAYGTGVIIVDQRPSQISSDALANTGMKIIHNINEGEDIGMIARSLSLRDYECAMFNNLDVGQAIIKLPQTHSLCRVRINGVLEKISWKNLAHVFNSSLPYEDENLLGQFERNIILTQGFTVSSLETCIHAIENKHCLSLNYNSRIVIISKLSLLTSENDLRKRQIMFDYLAYYRN